MATPTHLRHVNRWRIIRALLARGSATRAELARAVGLSQPTTGAIVDDLLAARILEPCELPERNGRAAGEAVASQAVRMGRPGQLVRLDRTRPRFLTIELGVTHTRLAFLPVAVQDGDHWTIRLPAAASPREWTKGLTTAVRRWSAQPIQAVLLSVPGVVDERGGRVLLCPNLRWVEQADLFDLLQTVSKAPPLVLQEIRALALGQLAVDPGGDDFLLVNIGDGMGGAAVVGGRLFESPIPLSGELGHTPVLGNKRICGCGAVGCVETLVSRRGLLASFAATYRRGHCTWLALARDIAEHGVRPWLADALDAAATVIAGALNVIGVRRVVVTGTLGELPEPVMAHLSRAVISGAMWARFGEVTCEPAPHRRMAGLVSAAIDRILLPDDDQSAERLLKLGRHAVARA